MCDNRGSNTMEALWSRNTNIVETMAIDMVQEKPEGDYTERANVEVTGTRDNG